MAGPELTPRQRREIAYHRDHAARFAQQRSAPVNFDVVDSARRRPWNAFWSAYDRLLAHDLRGKRVLIPGCGFGEDAARIARLGSAVEAIDLSPDIIDVARRRAATFGYGGVSFAVMPCESLAFPDSEFDVAFIVDILHHVDIPKTLAELVRVLKPSGRLIGDELYTHSALQTIRDSRLVDRILHPAMRRFIYGGEAPYITADERKIDERQLALIAGSLSEFEADWFNAVVGRLAPDRFPLIARIDRGVMKAIGGAGRLFAGRVVFEGVVRKS
jgi:ubiquinone/menaquinone biosynthesis C-methylase UbiE